MCYAHPGPRCSYHAKQKVAVTKRSLDEATETLDSAVALDSGIEEVQNRHSEALSAHNEAVRTFYTTPAGFKAMEAKITQGREEGKDSALLDRMERKLQALKSQRVESIVALGGDAQEEVDEETEQGSDFSRCDNCGQFVGSSHTCSVRLAYDEQDLTTWEPSQVDEKLAEHMYKKYRVEDAIEQQRKYLADYEKMSDPSYRFYRAFEAPRFQEKCVELRAKIDGLREEMAQETAHMIRYDQEYERRGQWTRAFIVTNASGHVHSSMNCSSCYPTTRYAWVTDYSGKDEQEIVSAAGERACTGCYPTAPVETRNSPTRIFTPDEITRQQARDERAIAREERERIRNAKAVSAPDGSTLRLSGRWGATIGTEVTARSRYVEMIAEERLREAGVMPASYRPAEFNEDTEILSEALSRKNNMTREEYDAEIEPKITAKTRALTRAWAR